MLFAALYHWYPLITGKMFNATLGKLHFWCTFLGTYAIYLPMHYLGFLGVPRRYYAMGTTDFIPESAQTLNASITVAAILVGLAQLIFIANVIWSIFKGEKSGPNPWHATTLEWQAEQIPPAHGNWGEKLPEVHRWAYDFSVPGARDDYIPQNMSNDEVPLEPGQTLQIREEH